MESSHVRDPLLQEVARAVRRHRLLRGRDSVLVGVSGGPDSVALLLALGELGRGAWRIGVAHVNHHLRGRESDRDQQFVEKLARRLGYEMHNANATLRGKANLEERARYARYRAFTAIARRQGYRRIATAHTIDDQAETVLHHVIRGTGGTGLAGVRRERADGVIRPLLGVSRAQVIAFLRRRGARHRLDRSNRDLRFTRNRLRARVLPLLERELNPRVKEALSRLAELSREDEDLLERVSRRSERRVLDGGHLVCAGLASIHPALQRRVVRAWLARTRGTTNGIELDHVDRIRALASTGRDGQRLSLPGGSLARHRGRLYWNPRRTRPGFYARRIAPGGEVVVAGWRVRAQAVGRPAHPSPWRAVFDAAKLGAARLRVRSPKPGDRIRPLGLGGTKKLQDVFVDAKVPRHERATWPILEAGGVIAWVAGLARSEEALVEGASRRLLVVEALRQHSPEPATN
jgi:tRNA(Ile)-lysidine synthase